MSLENPLCPQCQTELEDDFGIVDCKSCGAVCSVDLDGGVQLQGEIGAAGEEPEEDVSIEEDDDVTLEASDGDDDAVTGSDEDLEGMDYYQEQEESAVEVSDTTEEEHDSAILEEPVDYLKEQASESLSPMEGASFLKGLEIFTEEAQSESLGHVYYDLHVKGLDSRVLKDLFVENLFDERLDLSKEYLESLIAGKASCTVPQLSFLRLQVAVKRVLPIGLDLNWVLSEVQQPITHEVEGYDEEEYQSEEELEGEY